MGLFTKSAPTVKGTVKSISNRYGFVSVDGTGDVHIPKEVIAALPAALSVGQKVELTYEPTKFMKAGVEKNGLRAITIKAA